MSFNTRELATMAGLPEDVDFNAICRFATLVQDADRAGHYYQDREAKTKLVNELAKRIERLEARATSFDKIQGAMTTYIGEKEGVKNFFYDYMKTHKARQKANKIKAMTQGDTL